MSLTYANITPTPVFETKHLQASTPSLRLAEGKKFKQDTTGVCLALVYDWLAQCKKRGGVTDTSQLRSRQAVSLLQTAAQLRRLGVGDPRRNVCEQMADAVGLDSISNWPEGADLGQLHHTAYNVQAGVFASAVFALYGQGLGHAVAARSLGMESAEFFDPNVGVLRFSPKQDMNNWVQAFLIAQYPTLVHMIDVQIVD